MIGGQPPALPVVKETFRRVAECFFIHNSIKLIKIR
jgi:hypothetical protein